METDIYTSNTFQRWVWDATHAELIAFLTHWTKAPVAHLTADDKRNLIREMDSVTAEAMDRRAAGVRCCGLASDASSSTLSLSLDR